MKISVLGCGRWGSFHAWYASKIGHAVTLYGRAGSKNFERLARTGANEYLQLPAEVQLTQNLSGAVNSASVVVISGSKKFPR